jgi:predicted ester cyclase
MAASATPLEVYRRFQSMLINGAYGRLGEVVDLDGYTENCVGLTGWTTGLQVALRNFQNGVGGALTAMEPTEEDVIENDDMLVIRGRNSATHTGEFLGVPATGRRISYDTIDMFRVRDGRIVWRFLLCDWKGVLEQITSP